MTRRLLEMTTEELRAAVEELGQPPYRAAQLADWIYRKGVTDPRRMSNLPKGLAGQFEILTSSVREKLVSPDGTVKLLLETSDGEHVECVLIPTQERATACLSTQVGCAMGCAFCASGAGGLKRNLRSGEILEQVLHLRQAAGREVTNAVFMGMGEPLANYDATVAAVRALIDPRRFNISARRITVSTIGLPKQIRRLASEDLPITLAISLHAPNDPLRRRLMPRATSSIDEVLSAARQFYRARHREVTLEYMLLGGVNDTRVCAEALARIARRLRCNVNLIRYNPVEGVRYERPSRPAVEDFARRLRKRGINVQVRRSRGLGVSAACGQLRRREATRSSAAGARDQGD